MAKDGIAWLDFLTHAPPSALSLIDLAHNE